MKKITQEAHHRQRMMEYRQHHTLEATAIRYRTSRKSVVKWWKRWDGSPRSLEEHSRRPHSNGRAHSEEELRKIRHVLKKHRWQDVLLSYLRDGGAARIYAKLWFLQTDRIQTQGSKTEAKGKAYTQTLPARRVSGPEDAAGCEVCSGALHGGRAKVLPVYRQG